MVFLSILADAGSHIVLATHTNTAALLRTSECTRDTYVEAGPAYPNYTGSLRHWAKRRFLPVFYSSHPDVLVRWTWRYNERVFIPTRRDLIEPAVIAKSRLASAKAAIFGRMLDMLNGGRIFTFTGLQHQDSIYVLKADEARRFRAVGYSAATAFEYPFVAQYADIKSIPFRQAADEIIFKADLASSILARSESLRIRYFARVKSATTLEELSDAEAEFNREAYLNAKV